MPPVEDTGYEEEFLYEFGIGLGLSWTLSGEEEAAFIAAGPIAPTGLMTMEVAKNVGEVVPMSLLMTDVGFYDEAKIGYPLTPTFDLNAALGQGDIPVDDDGHAYGVLSGGMAYRYGYVVDALGNPVADAFVFMVLDSEDILAFNYAITDEYGIYEILVPATGPNMPYFFAAVDNPDAPTVAGFVRDDPYYLVTAADAVREDIWLDFPLD